MKDTVYTHVSIKENYKTVKLTSKQWKIYFYFLYGSKFNAQKVEDHRYIYKSELNKTQACKTLGIGSLNTFNNALKALKENGLLRETETVYMIYARDYVEIDRHILFNLLNFSKKKEADIDLLRTFIILKYIYTYANSKAEMKFSRSDIVKLLGHDKTNSIYYYKISVYLALLSYWGLIELKLNTAHNSHTGSYVIYHLQNIKEQNLNPEFETDIEAEMENEVMDKELFNKIQEKMGILVEE